MIILTIFVLCSLAALKVSLQSYYGKRFIKTASDNLYYNSLVFLAIALIFCRDIPKASLQIWCFAVVYGSLNVLFQLTYTGALKSGNVSLTVMMVNLSILFPVMTSLILFKEEFTVLRFVGITLTVCSFVLCADFKKGNREKTSGKWLALSVAAMLANAGCAVTQKLFGASEFISEKNAFIASSYAVAFVMTASIYLIKHLSNKRTTVYSKPQTYVFTVLIGIVLAVYQWLYTYTVSQTDGTFFFPVNTGVGIVLSTLAGVLIFKDKLTTKQKMSMAVGITAIVIMNL